MPNTQDAFTNLVNQLAQQGLAQQSANLQAQNYGFFNTTNNTYYTTSANVQSGAALTMQGLQNAFSQMAGINYMRPPLTVNPEFYETTEEKEEYIY